MRRRRIQVVVELLHVLAVIALAVGQAEQPLLEDWVTGVPQRETQAQPLPQIGNSGDAVLTPAIGATAGVIVRKVLPGVAVRTVVLADRAPLALGQVRAPLLPALTFGKVRSEARMLGARMVHDVRASSGCFGE